MLLSEEKHCHGQRPMNPPCGVATINSLRGLMKPPITFRLIIKPNLTVVHLNPVKSRATCKSSVLKTVMSGTWHPTAVRWVEIAYRVVGSPNMTQSPLAGRKLKPVTSQKMNSASPSPLPIGVDYPVQLIGGPHGALDIGNFRIDRVHSEWFPHPSKSRRETQPPFFSKLIMMHQVAV